MGSFVRVAAAVPVTIVGDVRSNTDRLIELIDQAAADEVAILVTPELAVCGYTAADLLHQTVLLDAVVDAVGELAECTAGRDMVAVIGAPVVVGDQLVNAAVVIADGRVVSVVPKVHLPTYGEFYDGRWFRSGREVSTSAAAPVARLGGAPPVDPAAVFATRDVVVGVELCEDLWVPEPPSGALAVAGAEVLVNPSASTELLGKAPWRRALVAAQSGRCLAGYVYASSGPTESTGDAVFGGHAIIAEAGAIVAESRRFARESQLVAADLDLDALRFDRRRQSSFGTPSAASRLVVRRDVAVVAPRLSSLRRTVDPRPFVPDNDDERTERCEEVLAITTQGLVSSMVAARVDHLVLGLSGGLDSTLAAVVATRALAELSLPTANLHVLVMPASASSDRTQSNAEQMAQRLGCSTRVVPIDELSRLALATIGHDGVEQDVTFENTFARMRTLLLMNTANLVGGLVVGTGDMSELALGWCTFNGDHMSMYNVNSGVPKTLVRHLVTTAASWPEYGAVAELLADVVATPISPELTSGGTDGIDQRTEDIVGPYDLVDFFLHRVIRHGDRPDKIAYMAGQAFAGVETPEDISRWLMDFFARFTRNQFKRDTMPNGPKVGTVALSPRADWRMSPQAGAWYRQ